VRLDSKDGSGPKASKGRIETSNRNRNRNRNRVRIVYTGENMQSVLLFLRAKICVCTTFSNWSAASFPVVAEFSSMWMKEYIFNNYSTGACWISNDR